jgi:predicted esterase
MRTLPASLLRWETLCLLLALLSAGRAVRAQATQNDALPPPQDAAEALRLSYYAYDPALPLSAKLKPMDANDKRARFHLSYLSAHDQRVTALIALPRRYTPPYPAVLLVHGAGGDKDTSYIQWISETLVAQGYATLSIDTQYHGERALPGFKVGVYQPDSYQMRDAWVQSVIDLRRAVDYLLSRTDIDKNRIGYVGISQGGMLGATLGGVEGRIGSFCLAVAGGGMVELVKSIEKYPLLRSKWPVQVTPEVLRRIESIAQVVDPIYFVGRIAPRPLLLMTATKDEVIPPEASEALVKAALSGLNAAQSVQVKRWEAGHVLHPNAIFTIRDFFQAQLGRRTPRTASR